VIDGKRIIVVMPAYNAEQTIEHAGHRGDATALAEAIKSIDAALLVTPDQPALLYTRAYAPYVASFLRPDPKSQVTAEKQLRDAAGLLERVKGAPWEIEAAALRGAILGSLIHLQKNPAQAGATLGPESSRLLAEAEVAAPTNPRLLIFRGQSLLFTPAEYGGNPEEGVALLKMSVEQFDHAPSATGPRWGHAEALAFDGRSRYNLDVVDYQPRQILDIILAALTEIVECPLAYLSTGPDRHEGCIAPGAFLAELLKG